MTKLQPALSPHLIEKRLKQALEHYENLFEDAPTVKHMTVMEDLAGNSYVTPLEMAQVCRNIKK